MGLFKRLLIVFALTVPLAACVEGTSGSGVNLATRGNLSAEAVRLQSNSERLLSLEQQQENAARRTSDFTAQAAVIGGLLGAVAGRVSCNMGNCSQAEQRNRMLLGAGAGAVGGGVMGNNQAQRQNQAAARENALRQRIQISSAQLTTAREARQRAESIARSHQRNLAKLKADVAAGRATQAQLATARADAQADARQLQRASRAMKTGSDSLSQSGGATNSTLTRAKSRMTSEGNATTRAYNSLVNSISNAAL